MRDALAKVAPGLKGTSDKSILDLSEGAESGAEPAPDLIRGPDSATPHQAHACSMRGKPSMA